MPNSGMDPNEDQISNWKMEPRDCTEHRRKDQKEVKWSTKAKEYEKEIQMFYCLSKRHSRWTEKEKITENNPDLKKGPTSRTDFFK